MAFTFGSGGGFGQQNNQQQQPAAPTFGGFGNNAATSTFGSSTPAFGQQPQQQQTSLFGSAGSGFGSTTATPAFGSGATNTGGGLFGSQPASTGGAFGGGSTFSFGQSSQPATGGGLFGGGNTNTGFGSGLGGASNANPNDPVNPNASCPIPTNGSADAPPHPKDSQKILMWKDNRNGTQTGPDGKQTTVTGEQLLFDNIVALPMYWHASPEELRAQDYAQNRKTAPAATAGTFGGFGQSTGTGAFGAAPATTGFGQTQPAAGGGLFGSNTSTNTGGGLFGGGGGAFGKPATTTPAFGQSTTGTTGGLFGQPAASTSTGFGQTAAAPSTFGGFGQNNNQQKPAFSFGGGSTATTQPTGGLFGGGATNTGFGQTQQSSTPAPTFGGFGQTNTNTTGGGLFGNAAKPATGGLFGNAGATADKPAFSFGQSNTTTQPTGGLFGNNNNQQQPAGQTGGGLFGNLGGGTSTFGQNNTASTGLGGGLFGNNANKPATGGLFGNNTATQQPSLNLGGTNNNTGGGLFGGGSSLFGNNNNQQNNQQQQQQQPQQGGGLFGGSSLFGNNTAQNQNNNASTGGFGLSQPGSTFGGFGQSQQNNLQQSQQQQQPLQPLNTSIDQNPYGNNPIFANVQPLQASGPQAVTIDSAKKQPALTISYRGVPRSTPKIAKLRGFTTSVSSPGLGASRFGSPAGMPGTPLGNSSISRSATSSPALALLNNGNGSFTLPPEAFVARPSVKKLVIDPKHRDSSDFLLRRRNGTATPTSAQQDGEASGNGRERITFNPHAETADRGETTNGNRNAAPAPATNKGKAPAMSASSSSQGAANGKRASKGAADRPLSDGDYYCKPSLSILKSMTQEDLGEVHDLTVGRVGFGEVCWLEPTDLTGLQSLDELLGSIVIIEDREVMVYPGEYEDDKPEVGHGLNVPAAVSLKNCWPLDKATRNPIKDGNNARVQQHVKKLRKKQETEFVDYEVDSGTWIFKVQHFSRYGLDESDEEDGDEDMQSGQEASSPAVQRKKAIQDRASRTAKRTRTAESPMSDTSTDVEDADYEDAPPQATLEDESMTEVDESATERSLSRTPRRRSRGADDVEEDFSEVESETGSERQRKRSVAAPTPRFAPTSRLRYLESPGKGGYEQSQRNRRQESPSNASIAPSESAAQRPIAQRLGLEPKKVAVMQASFFSKPSQESATSRPPPSNGAPAARPPPSKEVLSLPKPAAAPRHKSPPQQEQEQHDYVPTYKALRKWKEVSYTQSLAHGKAGQLADAGLSMSRSFRATWGPQGQLVHIGRLTTVDASGEPSRFSLVKIDQPILLTREQDQVADSAIKLLEIQLGHSEVCPETDITSPPLVQTLPSLRFKHFSSQFNSQDPSHEANLWRLGQALFDEIDLRLPETASQQLQNRVNLIKRRDAFSAWLKTAVAPAVEQDLRALGSSNSSTKAAGTVFALLTGNQVERACQSALSNGDVRLASLLAQVGGDDEFRADIDLQLQKWREYRVDPHLSKEYRKIYEVLSGNVEMSKGLQGHGSVDTSEDIMISEGLDWKRALAIRFWYARFDNSLPEAMAVYDADAEDDSRLSKPAPEHSLAEEAKKWLLSDSTSVRDALYEIIQLFTDTARSLESALTPRAFTASPVDYRQSWHLYETLARSMHIRDFEDVDNNGYSAKAEELAMSYADQLEKAGLWQWAAFVYQHLVNPESRLKAIEQLLARHVSDFTADTTNFLQDKLQIPQKYLDEARDVYGEEMEDRDNDQHEGKDRLMGSE